MELVLNLKPEEELQIRREAQTSGMELSEYALQRLLGAPLARKAEPRISARGKYRHLFDGSEEFAKRKQEEIAREDCVR